LDVNKVHNYLNIETARDVLKNDYFK